jgi:histidine triad (HIT) family protein
VYEDDDTLAFFDVNPVNEYHTLVIPKKHYKDIFEIPEDALVAVAKSIKNISSTLRDRAGIENIQIVNNSGKDAQQDIFHIHFHIVPRDHDDGQNIRWTTRPELREKYAELLSRLQ